MRNISIAYIFFAFFATFLLLVPSKWHWKAKNAGTILIIGWTCLGNVVGAISTIIFLDANTVTALSWCDFAGAVKYLWGSGCCIGGLILLKQLESIAKLRNVGKTMSHTTKFVIHLLVGVLTPLIMVPIHYAVQAHRMDEYQGLGCFVPVYPSYPSLFLIMAYPIIVSLVSAVYGIYSFVVRRNRFNAIIREKGSAINSTVFIKLCILGLLDLLIWLPLSIGFLATIFTTYPVLPYKSWSHVHAGFNFVGFYYPSQLSRSVATISELSRWTGPLIGVIFFLLFGIKPEHWAHTYGYVSRSMKSIAPVQRHKAPPMESTLDSSPLSEAIILPSTHKSCESTTSTSKSIQSFIMEQKEDPESQGTNTPVITNI